MKAGPRLVESRRLPGYNLMDGARDKSNPDDNRGWPWDILHTPKPRPAISRLPDGKVALCFWEKTTPREAAEDLMAAGYVDALAFDGGGSAQCAAADGYSYGSCLVPTFIAIMPKGTKPGSMIVSGQAPASDSTTAPATMVPAPQVPEKVAGTGKKLICVDPGHGRETDPGAIAWEKMTLEADLTLDIALHLEKYLVQAGYAVILTHRDPRELRPGKMANEELQARCDVAAGAVLFLSIHVDLRLPQQTGYPVLVL